MVFHAVRQGGSSMSLQEIVSLDKKYYMNTFGERTPVCFEYGKGINLWDTEGRMYYDFLGGLAVSALGHGHQKLVEAIKAQAEKLIHCSSLYYIENQSRLAQVLAENSCADRVFFANSGAEANEGAIKLARIYFSKKGQTEKYEIITMQKSFHGRTMATLSATGQEKHHKYYTPLTPSFVHVPINDITALEAAVNDHTCAIMIEPVQGESGVNPADSEYIKTAGKLCDEKSLLLIFDEIQTGLGRTGKLFGYQHYGVEPDIFTLAKALGGGVPIGAVCAKQFVAEAFGPGDHGSTFGGNPLACAAGLAAMNVILNEGLVENSEKMGSYFKEKLHELMKKHSSIVEIRGKGLMLGIQFSKSNAVEIKNRLFNKGFLVGNVGDGIIRMLPPLIVKKEDIDKFINVFDEVLV